MRNMAAFLMTLSTSSILFYFILFYFILYNSSQACILYCILYVYVYCILYVYVYCILYWIVCLFGIVFDRKPMQDVLASLCGSVGEDFVYHACGHEFKSRVKRKFSNFPHHLWLLLTDYRGIAEWFGVHYNQEVLFSSVVKCKKEWTPVPTYVLKFSYIPKLRVNPIINFNRSTVRKLLTESESHPWTLDLP